MIILLITLYLTSSFDEVILSEDKFKFQNWNMNSNSKIYEINLQFNCHTKQNRQWKSEYKSTQYQNRGKSEKQTVESRNRENIHNFIPERTRPHIWDSGERADINNADAVALWSGIMVTKHLTSAVDVDLPTKTHHWKHQTTQKLFFFTPNNLNLPCNRGDAACLGRYGSGFLACVKKRRDDESSARNPRP